MAGYKCSHMFFLMWLVNLTVPVYTDTSTGSNDYCIVSKGSGILCNASLVYGLQSPFQARTMYIKCEENSLIHVNSTHSLLMRLSTHNDGTCPQSTEDIDETVITDCSIDDHSSDNLLLKDLRSLCNNRTECLPSPVYYSSGSIHNETCNPHGLSNYSYLPIVMVKYLCLQRAGSVPYGVEPHPITFTNKLHQTGTSFLLQSNDYSHFARSKWNDKLEQADVTISLSFNISSTYCQINVPPRTLTIIGGSNLVFKKVVVLENGKGFKEMDDQECLCKIYIENTHRNYSETICTEKMAFKLPCGKSMETFNLYNINDLDDRLGIVFEIPLAVENGQSLNISCGFQFNGNTTNSNTSSVIVAKPPEIIQNGTAENQSTSIEEFPPLGNSKSERTNGVFRWDVLLGTLLAVSLIVLLGIIVFIVIRRKRRKVTIKRTRPVNERVSACDLYDEPDVKDIPADDCDYSTIRIARNPEKSSKKPSKRNKTADVEANPSEISASTSADGSSTKPAPPPKRPISGNLMHVLSTKLKSPGNQNTGKKASLSGDINLKSNEELADASDKITVNAFVNEALILDDTELCNDTTDGMINNEVYDSASPDTNNSSPVSGGDADVNESALYEEVGDIVKIEDSLPEKRVTLNSKHEDNVTLDSKEENILLNLADQDKSMEDCVQDDRAAAVNSKHELQDKSKVDSTCAVKSEVNTIHKGEILPYSTTDQNVMAVPDETMSDELVYSEPEPIVIKIKDTPIGNSTIAAPHLEQSGSDCNNGTQDNSLSDIEEEDTAYANERDNDTTQLSDYFTDDYSEVRRTSDGYMVDSDRGGTNPGYMERKDQLTPRLSVTEMVDNDVYNI